MTISIYSPPDEVADPIQIGAVRTAKAVYEWWSDGWRSKEDPRGASLLDNFPPEGSNVFPGFHESHLKEICRMVGGDSWKLLLEPDDDAPGRHY